jgi:dnd system-associated protein 4
MRNVRRALSHEVLVKMLAEKPHPKTQKSIFPTMRELLCFAAALGFQENRRKSIDGKTAEIDGRIFENSETATDLVYLVALAGVADVNILQPDREEEAVAVFEEYANGGLEILSEWMAADAGDIDGDHALLRGFVQGGMLGNAIPSVDTAMTEVKF